METQGKLFIKQNFFFRNYFFPIPMAAFYNDHSLENFN